MRVGLTRLFSVERSESIILAFCFCVFPFLRSHSVIVIFWRCEKSFSLLFAWMCERERCAKTFWPLKLLIQIIITRAVLADTHRTNNENEANKCNWITSQCVRNYRVSVKSFMASWRWESLQLSPASNAWFGVNVDYDVAKNPPTESENAIKEKSVLRI